MQLQRQKVFAKACIYLNLHICLKYGGTLHKNAENLIADQYGRVLL